VTQLQQERKKMLAELSFIDRQIKTIGSRKDVLEKIDKTVFNHKKLLCESAKIIDSDITKMRGRTRLWNNLTGLELTQREFRTLIDRFKAGDFNDGSKKENKP